MQEERGRVGDVSGISRGPLPLCAKESRKLSGFGKGRWGGIL